MDGTPRHLGSLMPHISLVVLLFLIVLVIARESDPMTSTITIKSTRRGLKSLGVTDPDERR